MLIQELRFIYLAKTPRGPLQALVAYAIHLTIVRLIQGLWHAVEPSIPVF